MKSPVKPLNIGFVGLNFGGYIADTLISGPGGEFFNVAAVCDVDASKVPAFAIRRGVKAYTRLDQLLADEEIDVVALFTGPAGRADLIRSIIHAGKDVMTTKPFELDPIAARSVLEEAESLGRVIHLNSPPPEMPAYLRQIREWQQEFDLGQPIHCRGEVLISYREKADGRWLDDPASCPAAPIFRLGIYVINDIVRLFGRVSEVQVMTSRILTQRPTADNAQLSLYFENKALGTIYATFCVDNGQHHAHSLILHYERGTIYRNMLPVAYGKAEGTSRLLLTATRDHREVITRECELPEMCGSYQWETFHNAVVGQRSVVSPIDDIVHSIEIVAAMARAEKSRKTEAV
ncbi:MAG: Gfo/Idh/MocA family oxidoreductase [Chthoniobacteraceae bacterium]